MGDAENTRKAYPSTYPTAIRMNTLTPRADRP